MRHVDTDGTAWHTSSYTNSGSCVEVADEQQGAVLVRDSKRRSGPRIAFQPAAWSTLVDWAKTSA